MLLGAEKFGNEEINPYFWFSKNNFEKPMKVINLGETDSVLNNIVAQMRDKTVQKDSLRFRYNLERLGHIFAYEISKVLDYSPKDVITPLATAKVRTCDAKIVVSTILRAGLPLHKGVLDVFDNAENAFIAAFRKYDKGDEFHINVEYCTCPDLTGKTLIIADTMLATGSSIEIAYRKLVEEGGSHALCLPYRQHLRHRVPPEAPS